MTALNRLELETIVKGIPAAIIVIEKASGRIVYANDSASLLFGEPVEGLTIPHEIGNNLKVFSLKGNPYSFAQLPVRQALSRGIEVEDEFIIERANGSRAVVRGLARPIKDENGSITAAVGIFEDITQRRRYEEGLRESEERFKLVAEAAKVLVYELNMEKGDITILRGEDVLGYHSGEIPCDQNWWIGQIHPDDRKQTYDSLQKAVVMGTDYFLEYRIKCKSGKYIIAHDTGKAVSNQSGKVIKFVGGMRNVTARKTAEHNLRTSELRFRSVFENSVDAVLLTIPDGKIISANPAAQRMFGMTEEEIKKAGRNGLVVKNKRLKQAIKQRLERGKFHG